MKQSLDKGSPEDKDPQAKRRMARAFAAGSSFFGSILGGYLFGRFCDFLVGSTLWLTLAGTITGFVSGNWIVYKIFMATDSEKE